MGNLRVAQRYASALMALTSEQKKPDVIADDLLVVLNALNNSRELRRFLSSPIITKDKKKAILADIFKKKVGELVAGYLAQIVNKGREDMLADILKQYFILRDEAMGIVRVFVKTNVEFSSKQEKELQKQIAAMTKKDVEITFSIDTTLKGGFVARIGDTVLDGSVKRQLELLKVRLKEGTLNN
jgi:F-type H+-transporting ATPase subunit delta